MGQSCRACGVVGSSRCYSAHGVHGLCCTLQNRCLHTGCHCILLVLVSLDQWLPLNVVTTHRPEVELEYKYVVRSEDGGALYWKPGDNCQIKVPVWLRVSITPARLQPGAALKPSTLPELPHRLPHLRQRLLSAAPQPTASLAPAVSAQHGPRLLCASSSVPAGSLVGCGALLWGHRRSSSSHCRSDASSSCARPCASCRCSLLSRRRRQSLRA